MICALRILAPSESKGVEQSGGLFKRGELVPAREVRRDEAERNRQHFPQKMRALGEVFDC